MIYELKMSFGCSLFKSDTDLPLRYLSFVPDHCNKANIKMKKVILNLWFSNACKSYVYAIL